MNTGKQISIPVQSFKLVNDPQACEFFADELVGVSHINGVCTLTFAKMMGDHSQNPPTNYRKVSGYVRLTLPGMFSTKQGVGQFMEQLEQQGVMVAPSQPPPAHSVQ